MKTNTAGGAGDHNAEGIPTGLDRKARRAVHAAQSEHPHGPTEIVKAQARLNLDNWTNQNLHYIDEVHPLVDDAYEYITGE